ncbi:MAG: glycosyltransferase family 1 protein [Fischerella sp.]|nr:glycosyltransferase family 1 protein [Fischerella sp.]
MKKILILTDNLPDQVNGVVTTFRHIQPLALRDGYDMMFVTPEDFKYFSAPRYSEVKLSIPWGLVKKIRSINPDYIHIATEGPIGLAGKFACKKLGYKHNTSYHTKFPEFLKKIYNVPTNFTYAFLRWFHRDSTLVLVPSKSVKQELERAGFTIPIKVWARGVDRSVLKPWSNVRKPRSKPVILYVGRLSREKNLDALASLTTKYQLIIVGDGPYRQELEKNLDAQFLGYKAGRDLAEYFYQADVFVFPSLTDTFGIVNIEAISLGTPVAAFPVTGPIDIVEPGVNGYLSWNIEEAVERALTLNRATVETSSTKWTWEECWQIFRESLTPK